MADTSLKKSFAPSNLTESTQADLLSNPNVAYYHNLARQVQHDLSYQHAWKSLTLHTTPSSPHNSTNLSFSRPLLSGVPPRHLYVHPDDQVEMLKRHLNEEDVSVPLEWVLPTHLKEKWSMKKFAQVFDAMDPSPPISPEHPEVKDNLQPSWMRERQKRILMAVVNDDSTIVYYIIHDGIVKPRQN